MGIPTHTAHNADGPSQGDPLLATKLSLPPVRATLVRRRRLIDLLDDAMRRKLTLVSAPAGFGKTTLVAQWAQQHSKDVAWCSLDGGDNDPTRFWTYFITAIAGRQPEVGESARLSLHSPQRPHIETVLTNLVNEMATAPDDLAVILDDYHLIDNRSIHEAVTFLLKHLPRCLHLVIITRSDPPLPLVRLRARGQFDEVRSADLRFTAEETDTFLNHVMDLDLSPDSVAALEERTEGWIAGLQLAVLSLRRRENVADFIERFAGDDRYVLDYLAEEVFRRQPKNVRSFMVKTAILERLSADLCQAVAGQENSQAMLERLESSNLFVIPLDNRRRWFRYHHLFADFLRTRLRQVDRKWLPDLHRRAAAWYAKKGLNVEAIEHALAGEDFEWAADLIEKAGGSMVMRGETQSLLQWLGTLPEDAVRSRPGLSISYAWALLIDGQLDAIDARLDDVERALSKAPRDEGSGKQEKRNRTLKGHVAAVRAVQACYRSEVRDAIDLSNQTLACFSEDNLFARSVVALNLALNLGHDYNSRADLIEATRILADTSRVARSAGDTYAAVTATCNLAQLHAVQGQLQQAAESYRRSMRIAAESGERALPVLGAAHVGLGDLLYEWDDLEEAEHHLREGMPLAERWSDARVLADGHISLAKIERARGDAEAACHEIREAERVARRSQISWLVTRVAAHRARLRLVQRDVERASRWAADCGLSIGDDIGFRRESEYTTLARVRMAEGQPDEALSMLEWLQEVTEGAGLMKTAIEVLTLQALAHRATGHTDEALAKLEQGLSLAMPELYVRLYVDEGPSMAELLRQARSRGVKKRYVNEILAAFSSPKGTADEQPLTDPLTEREIEVLQHISAGLSNREIAQKLVITVGTVKRHAHSIYGKLDASNRTEAAARARELGLLER